MENFFSVTQDSNSQRKGILKTPHGDIASPFFMTIATKGVVRGITVSEIRDLNTPILLGNTYHLWMYPGDEKLHELGGLHTFMKWNGPILTDSGGFQIFSLGERAKKRGGKSGVVISDEGVEFTDPKNGAKHFMTPEKSLDIQWNIGSDMMMILDVCPAYPASFHEVEESVRITTDWARRSLIHFRDRIDKEKLSDKERPRIFCIVQGGVYKELRERSAQELLNLQKETGVEWDGIAIGGVAVGEPREKLHDVLSWTLPHIPTDKPRYLMGLGRPEEIVYATKSGIDMFDCVIPTREGRHGRIFIRKSAKTVHDVDFYETLNITNKMHEKDQEPLEKGCTCPTCREYSRAYIRHLFTVKDVLGARLSAIHNIHFYLNLMRDLQQ